MGFASFNLTTFRFHRTILESYIQEPAAEVKAIKSDVKSDTEDEIISLDSDDEIPLKSQDVTMWFSGFLKSLERQYPIAFDSVVKSVMSGVPGKRRNALRNVLGEL